MPTNAATRVASSTRLDSAQCFPALRTSATPSCRTTLRRKIESQLESSWLPLDASLLAQPLQAESTISFRSLQIQLCRHTFA